MLKLFHHSRRPTLRHFGLILCSTVAICWIWSANSDKQQTAAEEKSASKTLSSLPPHEVADSTPVENAPKQQVGQTEVSAADDDASLRDRALGTWQDNYHGKRTLTLREDGTATMIVEPEGMGAVLFAKKLEFDIAWKIEQGILILKTLGGTPAGKIALVTKIYGDRAEEEILELTADRFLVAHDEETDFDWNRVPDAE